ncbi:hypothetical protein FDENT_8577 [Fusarium denticulatum]|uniref:Uncharacterized protein n=1 Tax=Fusarium denticulatum TaxID=48507 RepID=A0A8H5X397_9HYPO|nr:hypothetical protein FDENT_8577 [Fusarium denticulatum]
MGWNPTDSGIGIMPPFIIEPGTNYVKAPRNNLYLCIGYGDGSEPNFVATCDISTSGDLYTGFLTCEQTTDRKLKCSVPGVHSTLILGGRMDSAELAIDSSSNPPTDSTYQPIELGITPNEPK